jgi:hypothetical protein
VLAISHLVMALLFLASAALQYNDPDPLRWMAVYVGAAAACLARGRWRYDGFLAAVVGLCALVWALVLSPILPDLHAAELLQSMKAENPRIEQGREFLGLAIIAAWMAVILVTRGARAKGPR